MESSFRIVVLADSSRPSVAINIPMLRTLLSNIKGMSLQPNLIFFVGDMVYGGSKVNEQLEEWKRIFQEYYPLSMLYPVLGSHENNEAAFSNAFPYLPNEQLQSYQRSVYYVDYDNTRFIILNSDRTAKNYSYTIRAEQREWLRNLLAGSDKKYHFVFFHVPAFPTGHHYGESLDGSPADRNALWSILDEYKVTAVFVGHEHNYCRRLIDKTFSTNDFPIKNSIYQITTGGAGSSLNAHITNAENAIIGPLGLYHYCVLDIKNSGVSMQVYDKENNLIDSCSIYPSTVDHAPDTMTDILIPLGASWKYFDKGSDLKTSWRELNFHDSSWPSGLAELGYGDGGESTVISYGPNVYKKYITTYFRKHFTIGNTSIYKSLILRIRKDDGAVVYLNGKEVYRTNMPSGTIEYNTLALNALDGIDEISLEKAIIDTSYLKNGDNVIAVEIHQVSPSSSDISFDFQLIGDKQQSTPKVLQ
ncbi:metallophosphoesterase family protein [Clostridium cellulovorans]|uniref:Metallophosphoesterase n=1 Tax=Clostridium cellulovorans (strain ATCC 35296 / DSM 3052 / OCM 3 / 743B) TaxID=573061 RepID=D9SLX9_CLOC7|nr:metallophosphoesterase [Clostridium cellulovorans]ADL51710.1 metallophosphoesterase [Clostridium cellulovorans 743B]